jgi:hypothetical protein
MAFDFEFELPLASCCLQEWKKSIGKRKKAKQGRAANWVIVTLFALVKI